MNDEFDEIAVLDVDRQSARIYEEGWQSWSPSQVYRLSDRPVRPQDVNQRALGFRADAPAPTDCFQGEGLLAVFDGETTHVFGTSTPETVPAIRGHVTGDRIRITADGPVEQHSWAGPLVDGLARWADEQGLERWADGRSKGRDPRSVRPDPTVWCSWYHYFTNITQDDVLENLHLMSELDLPIDVVQIDDGYEQEIGDWLQPSGRFDSLREVVAEIRREGRRAGIWIAPWLVGSRSAVAARHPDWLVPGAFAGHNWGQDLAVLDTTHPAAAAHLADVLGELVGLGIDYVKIDFCYAGALRGPRFADLSEIAAYRDGLRLIRASIGDAFLLACGAPTIASIGLVDAMRVSADTAPHAEPLNGWLNEPGQRSAITTGRARHWQNRRLWVADPDCLIVRPGVEQRTRWAAHCVGYDGLRSCSDRLASLDDWGLATTRRYLLGGRP